MPISTSLRTALTTTATVVAVTLSLALSSSATAEDDVVSPGLPADTGTDVSPVAASSSVLEAPGVAPLAAPIGLALGPLILKPLYWIGLCDAVVITPPTVSR